jgi:hypothetical protein
MPEENEIQTEAPASHKLTLGENVIVTIKVLAGFGLLGAALWGIELLVAR